MRSRVPSPVRLCRPPGAGAPGGVFSVSAQVIGVCSSLGVPVMGDWLSRLCEWKTSKDLFASIIFVYVVAKCYNSVFIYLILFVVVLFFGTIPILIPV